MNVFLDIGRVEGLDFTLHESWVMKDAIFFYKAGSILDDQ